VLGTPTYFASRGRPRTPQELIKHECIGYRFPTAKAVCRWEFVRGGREFSLDPPGSIIVNDHLTMIALAKEGVGLAYTVDLVARRELASGELEPVLGSHLPIKPGLFLYFPAKSQTQPKLRTFIDVATRLMRNGRNLRTAFDQDPHSKSDAPRKNNRGGRGTTRSRRDEKWFNTTGIRSSSA
jgi:DNA-binding transcriptional LysR family regulator